MERTVATPRFLEALRHSVEIHEGQFRKGTKVPYVAHLLSVCGLVLADGGTEEEAIAALLHDALEDQPDRVTPDEIARRYGSEVLAVVEACTDTPHGYSGGPKPPWRQRKEAYLAHLRAAGASVRRVALADKLDNLRSIVADYREHGDPLWGRFNAGREEQVWFFASLREIFRTGGPDGAVAREFDRLAVELEKLCGGA